MKVEYLYPDNIQYRINEARYYGSTSNYNFNRTGGAKQKGVKGFFKALPSFLITTAISWPAALLGVIGALSYRWQKRWEDDNAKRQMLLPQYWTDYLANRHDDDDKNKDKNKKGWFSNDDDKDTSSGGTKTAVAAAGGAVAGGLLANNLKKLREETPEELKNKAFTTYWVTLSNGEIIRLRADSEKSAKEAANEIIKYTEKPCYYPLNLKIKPGGCPRYKFYLDSGEIVYWSGATKKDAAKEALETRRELAEIMNKEYPDLMNLDPIALPTKVVKTETKKGEEIPLPKQNSFISVSTTMPDFNAKVDKNRLLWEWGTLKQFKTSFFVFSSIYFPSENEREADKVVKGFFAINARNIERLINDYNEEMNTYKVAFIDGDLYHIPARTPEEAKSTAEKIHNNKYVVFEKVLVGTSQDDYEEIIKDFDVRAKGVDIRSIKNVTESSEKYKPKNPKKYKLIQYINKRDTIEYPESMLW